MYVEVAVRSLELTYLSRSRFAAAKVYRGGQVPDDFARQLGTQIFTELLRQILVADSKL